MSEEKESTTDPRGDGIPAQLHEEYRPPQDRQESSSLPYHGEAAVDIIFVHGLGSKYGTTWAYKRDDGSRYHWMREQLPKDMPDARIIGFEYPTRWYDDPIHTDLTECASELLRSVIQDRLHTGSRTMCRTRRTRPIIFVGHSFGGLVIKKAMTIASEMLSSGNTGSKRLGPEEESHRDFLSAIGGIIFLGTPHRGSSFSMLANWKIDFGRRILQVKSNGELVTILRPESYVLDDLQRQFSLLGLSDWAAGIKLVCYYEMKDVPYLRSRVVTLDSATLDNSASRGMEANHMEMNTFFEGDGDQRDHNYGHFVHDLAMILEESGRSVPTRFNKWVYGSQAPDSERESLMRKLDPSRDALDRVLAGNLQVYRSAPYTCQWIHLLPEFVSWTADESPQNSLWITGPAGSGKTVLASYIIDWLANKDARLPDTLQPCNHSTAHPSCGFRRVSSAVAFFLYGIDRKSETPERILATLIHQLLLTQPDNTGVFNVAKRLLDKATPLVADFVEALAAIAGLIGNIHIVIDGIDDTGAPEKLLSCLSDLRDHQCIRLLFSGQHTKKVAVTLEQEFAITEPIQMTDHTSSDIDQFTREKGASLLELNPNLKQKGDVILNSLQHGANGMFQWVNAAVEQLKYVEDPHDVEAHLESIPAELLSTYDKIFDRLATGRDETAEKRIRLCLQMIATSATPVTAADVKMAWLVQAEIGKDKYTEQSLGALFEKISCMERIRSAKANVQSYLGSIVQISSDGTLQLQHPSILKALTRTDWNSNSIGSRLKFSQEEAHRDVSHICMAVCRATTFVHANAFVDWRVPLVEYAWSYWAYHLQRSKFLFTTVDEAAQLRRYMDANPAAQIAWKKNEEIQTTFNKMIDGVSRDALRYLESLMDFISRPLVAVPGRFSDREYVLVLKRAQEALIQPSQDLCTLRSVLFDSISSRLSQGRRILEEQVPADGAFQSAQKQVIQSLGEAKLKLLGEQSMVRRLQLDEYLEENRSAPRPAGSARSLLETARNLRVVALRFAVDPIYTALLNVAGGSNFSPLHPLVYIAQLMEDSGSYPYWQKVPPTRDLMEPFICPVTDPEHNSAKFVLHCFEWRDPRLSETVATPTKAVGMFYARTARVTALDIRPSPSTHGLTRVSTENWKQVKRLHGLQPEQFYAAQTTYALFQVNDNYFSQQLANFHLKFSLLAHDEDYGDVMKVDPLAVLHSCQPSEIAEAPIKTYIRSIPAILNSIFTYYLVQLFEVFGQVGRSTIYGHFTKLQTAMFELRAVGRFAKRFYDPGELPPIRKRYILPAALVFYLRCVYFPSWGAYVWYHGWNEFRYAYNHPAAYLDLLNNYGWWALLRDCGYTLLYFLSLIIGEAAIILTNQTELAGSNFAHASGIYSIFYCLCTIDRSLFAMTSCFATLVASAGVMFYDFHSIEEITKFSMVFWACTFMQILIAGLQAHMLAQGNVTYKTLLATLSMHFAFIYLVITYWVPMGLFFWRLAKPMRYISWWLFNNALFASMVVVRTLGLVILLVMVAKATFWTHKFIWDPYDLRGSLRELVQAAEKVSGVLASSGANRGVVRVGWYPLGERMQAEQASLREEVVKERGPPRANAPMRKRLEDIGEVVTVAVGGFNESAVSAIEGGGAGAGRITGSGGGGGRAARGLLDSEVREVSMVDRIVLSTGDYVGRAVDSVGQGMVRAQEAVVERTRPLALAVRDAREGELKEE